MIVFKKPPRPNPYVDHDTMEKHGYWMYPYVQPCVDASKAEIECTHDLGIKAIPDGVKKHYAKLMDAHVNNIEQLLDGFAIGVARNMLMHFRLTTSVMQDVNFEPAEPLDLRIAKLIRDPTLLEYVIDPTVDMASKATAIAIDAFWDATTRLANATSPEGMASLSNQYGIDVAACVERYATWVNATKSTRFVTAADTYLFESRRAIADATTPRLSFNTQANNGQGGFEKEILLPKTIVEDKRRMFNQQPQLQQGGFQNQNQPQQFQQTQFQQAMLQQAQQQQWNNQQMQMQQMQQFQNQQQGFGGQMQQNQQQQWGGQMQQFNNGQQLQSPHSRQGYDMSASNASSAAIHQRQATQMQQQLQAYQDAGLSADQIQKLLSAQRNQNPSFGTSVGDGPAPAGINAAVWAGNQRTATEDQIQELNRQATAMGTQNSINGFTGQSAYVDRPDGGFSMSSPKIEQGFTYNPQAAQFPVAVQQQQQGFGGQMMQNQVQSQIQALQAQLQQMMQQQQWGGNTQQQQWGNQAQFSPQQSALSQALVNDRVQSQVSQPAPVKEEFSKGVNRPVFDTGFGEIYTPSANTNEAQPQVQAQVEPQVQMAAPVQQEVQQPQATEQPTTPTNTWFGYGYSDFSLNEQLAALGYVPGQYPRSVTEEPAYSHFNRSASEQRLLALVNGQLFASGSTVDSDGFCKSPLQASSYNNRQTQVTQVNQRDVRDSLALLNEEVYNIYSPSLKKKVLRRRNTVHHTEIINALTANDVVITEELLLTIDDLTHLKNMGPKDVIRKLCPTAKEAQVSSGSWDNLGSDFQALAPEVNGSANGDAKVIQYERGMDLRFLNHTNELVYVSGCSIQTLVDAYVTKRPYAAEDYELWKVRFMSYWTSFRLCPDLANLSSAKTKRAADGQHRGHENFAIAKSLAAKGEAVYLDAYGEIIKNVEPEKLAERRDQWLAIDAKYVAPVTNPEAEPEPVVDDSEYAPPSDTVVAEEVEDEDDGIDVTQMNGGRGPFKLDLDGPYDEDEPEPEAPRSYDFTEAKRKADAKYGRTERSQMFYSPTYIPDPNPKPREVMEFDRSKLSPGALEFIARRDATRAALAAAEKDRADAKAAGVKYVPKAYVADDYYVAPEEFKPTSVEQPQQVQQAPVQQAPQAAPAKQIHPMLQAQQAMQAQQAQQSQAEAEAQAQARALEAQIIKEQAEARAQQAQAQAQIQALQAQIVEMQMQPKTQPEPVVHKFHNGIEFPDTEVYTPEQLEAARLMDIENAKEREVVMDKLNKALAYRQSLGGEPCPVPVGHPPREGYPGQPNDFTDALEHPEIAQAQTPASEVKPKEYNYGRGRPSWRDEELPTVDQDPVLPSSIPLPEPYDPVDDDEDDFEAFFGSPDLTNIPSHPTDNELTMESLEAKAKAIKEQVIADAIPEELKDASYEEIMDKAKEAGHNVEDPKDKPFQLDWATLPLVQRKMMLADVDLQSPVCDRLTEKVIFKRNDKGIYEFEVVKRMDEDKHVIRSHYWANGHQDKKEAGDRLRVLAVSHERPAEDFERYVETVKEEIDKLEEDETVLILEAANRTPFVEIEEPLVTSTVGEEYQSEIDTLLSGKDMDPTEIISLLETNVIKYDRFITSGARITGSAKELIEAIQCESTARSLIVTINDFRDVVKLGRREVARIIKDFNRILNNHLAMIVGAGYQVNDFAYDYQTIQAEALLNLSNKHSDQEIIELIDKAYKCAALECFNITEVLGGSKGEEDVLVLGRTETIVLLPVYSEFYNITNIPGEASVISNKTKPELHTALERITRDGEYGTFRIVTLDNVVWTVMADEDNIYLLDVKD